MISNSDVTSLDTMGAAPAAPDEILRYAVESGILDEQYIRRQIEMKKRAIILKQHPYPLTYNEKKDRWYTRFDNDGKLIQRNRKTREELEALIIDFYENASAENTGPEYSFSQAHDRWMEMQKEYGRLNNTIRRYETDWNRFFSGTELENQDIHKITPQDIELFMIKNIKQYNLKRRSSDLLYCCISGAFYNAVMDKKLKPEQNPCSYVDKKKFVRFYNVDDKTPEERTLSAEDLQKLIERINLDIEKKESHIYPYGVRLALLTGMRVGEIAGLRWAHVYDTYIKVCESEKYDVVEKQYHQSKTKTGKIRTVPITNAIRQFLNDMKELQAKYGITEDFVLSFGDGKLRCKNLTGYMNYKCIQIGFSSHKSIHAIRRTFNSFMRFDGVSATIAGSIIGNTPKVNDSHYTYDMQNLDTKKEFMERAEQKMLGN